MALERFIATGEDGGRAFIVSRFLISLFSPPPPPLAPGLSPSFSHTLMFSFPLSAFLRRYRDAGLGDICDYTVQLSDGAPLKLPYDPTSIVLFCCTNKTRQYFDLQVMAVEHSTDGSLPPPVTPDGAGNVAVSSYANAGQLISGVRHSGDIGSLLHYATIDTAAAAPPVTATTYLIAAVGYSLTPLHEFADQLPNVVLVNHVTKTCTVVPCSIARVDVGESTFTVLAAMRRSPLAIDREDPTPAWDVTMLPRPCNVERVNTAVISPAVRNACHDAVQQFSEQMRAERAADGAAHAPSQDPMTAAAASPLQAMEQDPVEWRSPTGLDTAEAALHDIGEATAIYAVEAGVAPVLRPTITAGDHTCSTIHFGNGMALLSDTEIRAIDAAHDAADEHRIDPSDDAAYTLASYVSSYGGSVEAPPVQWTNAAVQLRPSARTEAASVVNLPGLFGPMRGTPALALGQPSVRGFSWAGYHRRIEEAGIVAVELSVNWRQTVASSTSAQGNGLFVINADQAIDASDPDQVFREIKLMVSALNRTGTIMAGPNSIILVRLLTGTYVWYRGVRWAGLFDLVPDFCADVTEVVAQIPEWVAATGGMRALPWTTVVSRESRALYFQGARMPLEEFLQAIAALNFATLSDEDLQRDIKDVCTQLCVLLPPDQLQAVVLQFRAALNGLVDGQVGPQRDEMASLSKRLLEDPEARHRYGVLRGQVKTVTKQVKLLVGAISSMVSTHGSSTMSSDLDRLNRVATVQARVERAESMSKGEIGEMFESIEEWFIAEVNTGKLTDALKEVQGRQLKAVLASAEGLARLSNLAAPHPTCLELDGCTVEALMAQSSHMVEHPLASDRSVAFPTSMGQEHTSALPIPLFEKFIDLQNPGEVHWADLSTEEEKCATWRILLRQSIVQANCSRTMKLNADDFQITFFICHVLLDLMEDLTSRIGDLKAIDWDDTTPRMMRGLFGVLLSTLASGKEQPCSKLWQMVKQNTKMELPSNNEYWIAVRMLRVFRYTKWSTSNMYRNGTQLFVKSIRRNLTDPLTEGLRKSVTEIQKRAQVAYLVHRDAELFFLGVVSQTFHQLLQQGMCNGGHALELKLVADHVLAHKNLLPAEITSGGLKRVLPLLEQMQDSTTDWQSDKTKAVLQLLLNIYCKRSAVFKPHKQHLLRLLSEGDTEAAEACKLAILRFADVLASLYGGSNGVAKVQNLKAVEALDQGALAGDAELNRLPWAIQPGAVTAEQDTIRIVTEIMDSVASLVVAGIANAANPTAAGCDAADSAVEKRKRAPGSVGADDTPPQKVQQLATVTSVAAIAALTPEGTVAPAAALSLAQDAPGMSTRDFLLRAKQLDDATRAAEKEAGDKKEKLQAAPTVAGGGYVGVNEHPPGRSHRKLRVKEAADGGAFPARELEAMHAAMRLPDCVNGAVLMLLEHWRDPAKGQAEAVAFLRSKAGKRPKLQKELPAPTAALEEDVPDID